MSSRKIDRKKILLVLLSTILVVALLFIVLRTMENKNSESGEIAYTKSFDYNGRHYERNKWVDTLLIVGLDKFEEDVDTSGYYNDQQADFILLLAIDHQNKQIKGIQINRDTMADVNVLGVAGNKISETVCQIAISHCYGNGELVSLRNTADSVSKLLYNLGIDYYVSVTMDTVSKLNDMVGGVPVLIEDDFSSVDARLVQGETVTLDGEMALEFVRARSSMSEPTNMARMGRQKTYMYALADRLREAVKADEDFYVNAFLEMGDSVTYNTTETRIKQGLEKISDYEFAENGIISFDGVLSQGEKFMEFYPETDQIAQTVAELFYIEK